MKKLLFILFLSIVFFSCRENMDNNSPSSSIKLKNGQSRARISQQDLAPEMSKNSYFIEYQKVQLEIMNDIVINKHNVGKINRKYLASVNNNKKLTFKDLADNYRKAGITEPEEYLRKNIKLLYHWGKLVETYPELKELTKQDRKILFNKIRTYPKIDVKKFQEVRKGK